MKKIYCDVAVIGGGPAGMMAAGRAAEIGARVVLVEKNSELGKKLSQTGGGRCNLTNAEFDARKFIGRLGKNGKFFFSPLAAFGVQKTIDFFNAKGVATKIEDRKRVFPVSNNANDVVHALKRYIKEGGVTVMTDATATGFNKKDSHIRQLILKGAEIEAGAYIMATGGRSRPETGSSGEGLQWMEALGHRVLHPEPALVPLKISDAWVKKIQGLSMDNVRVTVLICGKKDVEATGTILFTHFGISGPTILDLSRRVGELLKTHAGDVFITLDIKQNLTVEQLDERIKNDFKKYYNKMLRNSLDDLLPRKLIPVVITMARLDPSRLVNEIKREERRQLATIVKAMTMTPIGLLGFDKAIASSGGVDLKEIDSKTMRSKVIENLYLVGDILDTDAPTGGFNLQLCWSAGYVAGGCAAHQALEE